MLKGEYGSEVLDILRQYPVNVLAYENEKLWCDKPTDRIKRYAKNSFIPYYVTEDLRELVSQDFSKIIAISDNEKLSQIQQACNSCGLTEKVGVFFSGEDILEFNPYNIASLGSIFIFSNKSFTPVQIGRASCRERV